MPAGKFQSGVARTGRLQADAAQFSAAVIRQQYHRSFFHIRFTAAAFEQAAALLCDGFEHAHAIQSLLGKTVARGEQAGVAREQRVGEIFGDFLVDGGIAPDRVDSGELETVVGVFDLRPVSYTHLTLPTILSVSFSR